MRLCRIALLWQPVVLFVFFAGLAAHAQSGTATLNGQVLDPQHAAVPNAAVTLTSTSMGTQRQSTTNKEGYFTFGSLMPDSYSLRAEHAGFSVTDTKNIVLHTADDLSMSVTLKVGAVSTEVSVDGTSLTSDSPAVSLTVRREFVENMPLNGRSFQDLIQLAPGAVSYYMEAL